MKTATLIKTGIEVSHDGLGRSEKLKYSNQDSPFSLRYKFDLTA